MTAIALDVEVEVPDHKDLINDSARESIEAAVNMIKAGTDAKPVITMLYLLGYFNGLVQV